MRDSATSNYHCPSRYMPVPSQNPHRADPDTLTPKFLAGDIGPLNQGIELGPHDRGVNAAI